MTIRLALLMFVLLLWPGPIVVYLMLVIAAYEGRVASRGPLQACHKLHPRDDRYG